jgi:uncharacterized membrane protein
MNLVVFLIGSALLTLLVHLTSLLLLPTLATRDAYSRLSEVVPANSAELLPSPTRDATVLPFTDPATVTAICRYDVSDQPVRLRVSAPGTTVGIVFMRRGARIFYMLNDRSAVRGVIDVLLVTAEQLTRVEAEDPDDQPVTEIRLVVPEASGAAVVRALATTPGSVPAIEAQLSETVCEAAPLPDDDS